MKRANKAFENEEGSGKEVFGKKDQTKKRQKNEKGYKMKLPIGIQTFSEMREVRYAYADKTKEAYELISNYKYAFLSRPSGFGKSVFLDTLSNIFEGKKENFKGLYIEDKHDFNDIYPVIRIGFGGSIMNEKDTIESLDTTLRENQKKHNIWGPQGQNVQNSFKTLLERSFEKYKKPAVVLIDDYDRPLLDNIINDDTYLANSTKMILRDFYGVIKNSDKYIKFMFLTGATNSLKKELFPDLNALKDITFDSEYSNICGFTQKDMEISFKHFLEGVDLNELKFWYGGNNYLKDKLYTPNDVLQFCDTKAYRNYKATKIQSFLVKQISKSSYYLPDMENSVITEDALYKFGDSIESLLFEMGYLTIKDFAKSARGEKLYSLTMPNKEVRISLYDAILNNLVNNKSKLIQNQDSIFHVLSDGKLEEFQGTLKDLFALISHNDLTRSEMQNIIFAYISSLGFPVQIKKNAREKDFTMSISVNTNSYIFAFNVREKNGLDKYKTIEYHEKYMNEQNDIYVIGINFEEEINVIYEKL